MSLHNNLRDSSPRNAFLEDESANILPALTSVIAAALVKRVRLSPDSDMATAIAAYLCGYGALPVEKMSCATSAYAVRNFVVAELGSRVKVLSSRGTSTAASSASKVPVTVAAFTKGSSAETQTIVVCHGITFPTLLFSCHRVTGTKVITAKLQSAGVRPFKSWACATSTRQVG